MRWRTHGAVRIQARAKRPRAERRRYGRSPFQAAPVGCPEPRRGVAWKKCEGGRSMMRMVVFVAIGVMGLILVRVRRQRKARTVVPAE